MFSHGLTNRDVVLHVFQDLGFSNFEVCSKPNSQPAGDCEGKDNGSIPTHHLPIKIMVQSYLVIKEAFELNERAEGKKDKFVIQGKEELTFPTRI